MTPRVLASSARVVYIADIYGHDATLELALTDRAYRR
jgi:hypothetical protein